MTLLRPFNHWIRHHCIVLALTFMPGALLARETIVELEDGSSVKVFLFEPADQSSGPWPLTILMSGGSGNDSLFGGGGHSSGWGANWPSRAG